VRSPDTTEESHERQLAALRALGPDGRLAATIEMCDLGRQLAAEGIRSRHPEYDDRQVVRALVWLFYGESTARKVWPGLEPCRP
jgi:hypothetical protein